MGARFNLKTDALNFDNEVVYQFGSFGPDNISAWTISFNVWQQWAPITAGFKTELISGDDGSGSLGTFNPLYPRGAYFGRVARFGPANLIDFHPYVQYRKGKLFLEVDYDHFWRFSRNDGIYDPAMNVVLAGDSPARTIAGQLGTLAHYELNTHFAVELETNFIFVNDFISDLVADEQNLFHMVFTTEVRF